MKLLKVTLLAGFLLSACATTPQGPEPTWKSEATDAAKREAMWNYEGSIPSQKSWPGVRECSGGIVGFSCNVKTIDRGLKVKKLSMPSEYAGIYADPIQADAVVNLLKSVYVNEIVLPEEMGVFLSSKYGGRYLRQSYIYTLAERCGEKISKSEKKLLTGYVTGTVEKDLVAKYVCETNSAFNEKALPVHTNKGGYDVEAAMKKENSTS